MAAAACRFAFADFVAGVEPAGDICFADAHDVSCRGAMRRNRLRAGNESIVVSCAGAHIHYFCLQAADQDRAYFEKQGYSSDRVLRKAFLPH